MPFILAEIDAIASLQLYSLPALSDQPTFSFHHKEQLLAAGRMFTNLATRLELDAMNGKPTLPASNLLAKASNASKGFNPSKGLLGEFDRSH